MDLISRTLVIAILKERLENYRKDTELGKSCREGILDSISVVEDENFTLEHLGYSELRHLIIDAQNRLFFLSQEKTIDVFAITGLHVMRYTLDKDKAKSIFLEEIDHINEDDGVDDFLGQSLKIEIKKVRESDLAAYTLE